LALDPLDVIVQSFYAVDLYFVPQNVDAIGQARKALAVQADAPVARGAINLALAQLKKCDEVMAMEKQWLADCPEIGSIVEKAYPKSGYEGAWGKAADVQA
jgi:hypothetical protein